MGLNTESSSRGEYLETAYKIDTLVLDKTGTITVGRPEVTDIISLGQLSDEDIIRIAGIAEKNSEHPLGEAVYRKSKAFGVNCRMLKTLSSARIGTEDNLGRSADFTGQPAFDGNK